MSPLLFSRRVGSSSVSEDPLHTTLFLLLLSSSSLARWQGRLEVRVNGDSHDGSVRRKVMNSAVSKLLSGIEMKEVVE